MLSFQQDIVVGKEVIVSCQEMGMMTPEVWVTSAKSQIIIICTAVGGGKMK